ncbi:MAG TPA: hypothetical protein ENI61_06420 [Ignavibacteria bacterium]|nr:hypothetical protein [Ignavibacteria bacterium]
MSFHSGGHLHDSEMRVFNHRNGKSITPDWSKKDKSLSLIMPELIKNIKSSIVGEPHLIKESTPISNQGPINDCVANAWADMMEILSGLDGNPVNQLSRLFLYWISRYYTGDTDKDNGTYLRSAATQLKNVGIVDEKFFPYEGTIDIVYKSPELDLYTMASNNRLSGFYKPETSSISQLLTDLEISIRSNHPFVFGVDVDIKFEEYAGEKEILTAPSGEIKGSHAMICTGVGMQGSKRWWRLRNSWGENWGDLGHVKVDDSYIESISDIWVGVNTPEIL